MVQHSGVVTGSPATWNMRLVATGLDAASAQTGGSLAVPDPDAERAPDQEDHHVGRQPDQLQPDVIAHPFAPVLGVLHVAERDHGHGSLEADILAPAGYDDDRQNQETPEEPGAMHTHVARMGALRGMLVVIAAIVIAVIAAMMVQVDGMVCDIVLHSAPAFANWLD